jgi:hypothetical protein
MHSAVAEPFLERGATEALRNRQLQRCLMLLFELASGRLKQQLGAFQVPAPTETTAPL